MVRDNKYSKMETNTLETTNKENLMAEEDINGALEDAMKEILNKAIEKDLEHGSIPKASDMKDNLKMIIKMGRVNNFIEQERGFKAFLKMDKKLLESIIMLKINKFRLLRIENTII